MMTEEEKQWGRKRDRLRSVEEHRERLMEELSKLEEILASRGFTIPRSECLAAQSGKSQPGRLSTAKRTAVT
jgi:hypothetical protein